MNNPDHQAKARRLNQALRHLLMKYLEYRVVCQTLLWKAWMNPETLHRLDHHHLEFTWTIVGVRILFQQQQFECKWWKVSFSSIKRDKYSRYRTIYPEKLRICNCRKFPNSCSYNPVQNGIWINIFIVFSFSQVIYCQKDNS